MSSYSTSNIHSRFWWNQCWRCLTLKFYSVGVIFDGKFVFPWTHHNVFNKTDRRRIPNLSKSCLRDCFLVNWAIFCWAKRQFSNFLQSDWLKKVSSCETFSKPVSETKFNRLGTLLIFKSCLLKNKNVFMIMVFFLFEMSQMS